MTRRATTTITAATIAAATAAWPTPTAAAPTAAAPTEDTYYITGYSWWDNTPPGTATIAYPQLHKQAGGAGSYTDPVTIAVGHSLTTGRSTPIYPPGTRFYAPHLRRYLIVEDACGDGPKPQNGPCTVLPRQHRTAAAWLDVWVDGRATGRTKSDQCMNAMTGAFRITKNPPPGLPRTRGPIC